MSLNLIAGICKKWKACFIPLIPRVDYGLRNVVK